MCNLYMLDLRPADHVKSYMWNVSLFCHLWMGQNRANNETDGFSPSQPFYDHPSSFVPKCNQTKHKLDNRKPEKQQHIKLFILERFLYCKPWDNISHSIFSDNTSKKEFILCTGLIIETATWQVRKVAREGQNLAFPSLPHSCTITPWSGCKCQIVVYRRLQKWSDPLMRDLEGAWWGPGYVFYFYFFNLF